MDKCQCGCDMEMGMCAGCQKNSAECNADQCGCKKDEAASGMGDTSADSATPEEKPADDSSSTGTM